MISIIGFIIVTTCVVGGFLLEGGHMAVLYQPIELLIIGGSALGSVIVSCSGTLIKAIVAQVLGILKPNKNNKDKYLELVKLLYELFKMAAGNPLSLESHVEKPEASAVFNKYPLVAEDHHAVDFICTTLILQISASISPYDLEDLMDTDIATLHEEEAWVVKTLNRVSDALPGLGIVAAVIGIIITMGKLTQGKEIIGHSVAAALVGTFLGVLLSYGFMAPLTAKVENNIEDAGKVLSVIKAALLAYAKGANPKVCAEFARRSIPSEHRPSFAELDKATASMKAGGDAAAPAKKKAA